MTLHAARHAAFTTPCHTEPAAHIPAIFHLVTELLCDVTSGIRTHWKEGYAGESWGTHRSSSEKSSPG